MINWRFLKQPVSLGTLAALSLAQSLVMTVPVKAETTARLDGRCKLMSQDNQIFDGHCIVKQKKRDNTTIVVVKLDNGNNFRFYGPGKQALQVETFDGIHNVQYREKDNRETFVWNEDGDRQKLAIVLDSQKPANVSHDNPTSQQIIGAAIGVGVGALIGGLIAGGGSNQSSNASSSTSGNPYYGKGFNATASFRCSVGNDSHNQSCPGGIMRKGNGNASVTVLYPNGNEVQYDFKGGNVTSTFDGDLTWGKDGDEWYIGIDRNLFIIIPDAAIYGG